MVGIPAELDCSCVSLCVCSSCCWYIHKGKEQSLRISTHALRRTNKNSRAGLTASRIYLWGYLVIKSTSSIPLHVCLQGNRTAFYQPACVGSFESRWKVIKMSLLALQMFVQEIQQEHDILLLFTNKTESNRFSTWCLMSFFQWASPLTSPAKDAHANSLTAFQRQGADHF